MSEFRKGDVCSLEVTVSELMDDGQVVVTYEDKEKGTAKGWVPPYLLTLLRRAPVDLATCDLPAEVCFVSGGSPCTLLARDGREGWILPHGGYGRVTVKLTDLRPADAPVPDHIMINGHAVPRPMQDMPEVGERYWTLSIFDTYPVSTRICCGGYYDTRIFRLGLCHATREAAQAHFDALIAPTKREDV